jgi:DNA topoisomerase-1
MICEREREIEAFVPQEYWTITAVLRPEGSEETFEAELVVVGGKEPELGNEEAAQKLVRSLQRGEFRVAEVEVKEENKYPWPPFITSTLQQGAWYRLRLSSYRTMRLAQELYQGVKLGKKGAEALITYIRTDSVRIADQAVWAARRFIQQGYGDEYVPDSPRHYKVKATAQDAHEAIRPTSVERTPDSLKNALSKEEWALYDLIWRRFVACQMASALFERTRVDIEAKDCTFRANGSKLLFDGYLKVEGRDDKDKLLPPLQEGQSLHLVELKPEQHFTEPPPRYNEASLVKALEENGIGRPSTYAPILGTLRRREYVEMERRNFRPTSLGLLVSDFLVQNFPEVVNVNFTAEMELELDKVASGSIDWRNLLSDFYQTFQPLVAKVKEVPNIEVEEKCPQCGRPLAIRSGKFGRFYGCTGYPECKYIRPLKPKEPAVIVEDKVCPQCGRALVRRKSRFGTFVGCSGYPECKYIEKKRKAAAEPKATGIPCPIEGCGGTLVRRRGPKGYFYGCSNYPDCRYTSPIEKPRRGEQSTRTATGRGAAGSGAKASSAGAGRGKASAQRRKPASGRGRRTTK